MSELLQLFLSFVQIGLFFLGGGYAAVPLIQSQVVDIHHWLSMEEFTNLLTIAEMTPGPMAVNSATFVGIRLMGIPGACVATFGCILPSLVLVTLLGILYNRYRTLDSIHVILQTLRPVVVALIASAFYSIFTNAVMILNERGYAIDWMMVVLFIAALISIRKLKWNSILTMLGCGVIYMGIHLLALI